MARRPTGRVGAARRRVLSSIVGRLESPPADGDQTHTGQLFFEPSVTSAVYALEPYAARGEQDVPNSSDGIYAQSGGVTVVAVEVGEDSSSGSVTLGVQRS